MTSVVKFKATVERIIFAKPMYTIMLVALIDEAYVLPDPIEYQRSIVVMGNFSEQALGTKVEINGEIVENEQYGFQIKAYCVATVLPDDTDAILLFLQSKAFKGIGKKRAAGLVALYGKETLNVIQDQPARVSQECNIKENIIIEAANYLSQNIIIPNLNQLLSPQGFSDKMIFKIYEQYGNVALIKIHENPYSLCQDIPRLGFAKVDALAISLGYDKNNSNRLKAIAHYVLDHHARTGSTLMLLPDFLEAFERMAEDSLNQLTQGLSHLMRITDTICLKMFDGKQGVTKQSWYTMVSSAKECLRELCDAQPTISLKENGSTQLIQEIQNIASDDEFALGEDQAKALEIALTHTVALITGGPGTGKTTILRTIAEYAVKNDWQIFLLAPTGRAARRIQDTTKHEAATIHRFLANNYNVDIGSDLDMDIDFEIDFSADVFDVAKANASSAKQRCYIVDEFSMVDIFLFARFIATLQPGDRLIMIGDDNQLPSVGAGAVLRDLIESKCVVRASLRQLFRQAKNSLIVHNANAVLKGEQLIDDPRAASEFHWIKPKETDDVVAGIKRFFETANLREYGIETYQDVQILSAITKGPWGTIALNEAVQATLVDKTGDYIASGGQKFYLGDKVIMTENRYNLKWVNTADNTTGKGIMNGEMGIVVDLDAETDTLMIQLDDSRVATFTSADYYLLKLGYAISIHKSQGSEYKMAIIFLPPCHPQFLSRNLLYTAITRAKKHARIFASTKTMHLCLSNTIVQRRLTLLGSLLRGELLKQYG